jgi:hypothetical protein
MGETQGKKIATRRCSIVGRGEAGLRPDQAIGEAVWSGRMTVRNGEMAARRCRQDEIATDLTGELRLLFGPITAS